ncbi:hypothetical protein D3C86_1922920 [compost metagenome]
MFCSSRGDCDGLHSGRQQTLDFRDTRAALRAATQFLLQALEIQAATNAGAHGALTDVFAVAQGFLCTRSCIRDAGWGA